jgi:hypothetical protein
MNLKVAIEERMRDITEKRKRLVLQWDPYISAVNEWMQGNGGGSLTDFDKQNMAQCLENALIETGLRGNRRLLQEATTGDAIQFMAIQLPVIAALIPSLVLNKVAIVQALDRRQGAVFYLDALYGTTKGSITAGDSMINAQTGHDRTRAGRRYAVTTVENETLADDSLVSNTITGSLDYRPMLGTVQITHGSEIITDKENPGQLISETTSNPCGWVKVDGTFSVTLNATPTSGGNVTVNYCYYYDTADSGSSLVPEVNIQLRAEMLTAQDFPLQAKYSVGSSIDLEKAHGLILEDEIIKFLGGEIKFEVDQYGLDQIYTAATGSNAATGTGTWTAVPGSGQEWLWKKYEFLDRIEYGSNNIYSKTLRAFCNFIVASNNVARIIRQMGDHFKPAPGLDKQVPTGPIELGTLDGRLVIQDPFLTADRYVLGFRGDNYLFAGAVYAPYIPLFSTPTLVTADLMAQKGFMSSAGFKVTNEGMFTYGDVDMSGLST